MKDVVSGRFLGFCAAAIQLGNWYVPNQECRVRVGLSSGFLRNVAYGEIDWPCALIPSKLR